MISAPPWMPWDVMKWLHDPEVQAMHRTARSMYFDLLNIQWVTGPLPDDLHKIAAVLHELPRSVAPHWQAIRARFDRDSQGRLLRLDIDSLATHARVVSEKRSNAAKHKNNGSANAPLDQRREEREEKRRDPPVGPPSAQTPLALVAPAVPVVGGKARTESQKERVDRWVAPALEVLAFLNAARRRVIPRCRETAADYAALAGICERLDAGKTVADCMAVIEQCEVEVRNNPASAQYFNAVTPFRADNFERKLGMAGVVADDEDIGPASLAMGDLAEVRGRYEAGRASVDDVIRAYEAARSAGVCGMTPDGWREMISPRDRAARELAK